VRAVLWSGEPMTPARQTAITAAFPGAGFWGNYGSIETFVIGISRPGCRLGALHLLPDQVIEPDAGGALLTRAGEGWPTPAQRLRLGDRLRPAECPCGDGDTFEVVGRADGNFKLYAAMIETGPVLRNATRIPGVDDAQIVVYRDRDVDSAVVGMRIRYTGANTDVAAVRREIVLSLDDLEVLDRHTPEAVVVEHTDELVRNPSTDKVLPILNKTAAGVRA
jgi:phenylacetate-CoA ligase